MKFAECAAEYLPLILEALRDATGKPLSVSQVASAVQGKTNIPKDIFRKSSTNGRTIFENYIRWCGFYLNKASAIVQNRNGLWELKSYGQRLHLSPEDAEKLLQEHRLSFSGGFDEDNRVPFEFQNRKPICWLVGAKWSDGSDQFDRFMREGVWIAEPSNLPKDAVRRMQSGDSIVIKAAFVQKKNLPFEYGGKHVSVMRIKATGVILENIDSKNHVKVQWDNVYEPRDWYFYTVRTAITPIYSDNEKSDNLLRFIFRNEPQDYSLWLGRPRTGTRRTEKPTEKEYPVASPEESSVEGDANPHVDISEAETVATDVASEPVRGYPYTLEQVIADGCFLPEPTLSTMLARWRAKKNLILQGPPGTGKTWLAKRLGFALIGSDDRETMRTRLRIVQFHPSLSYEDFVRGYRPTSGGGDANGGGDGRLALQDGVMMEAIEAAASEPDRPFVLVIEEINRGNPAQILGEMLTLLESTKRKPSEAMELTYRKTPGERVHVPDNLYVIGTMNIADRSLALVDLALRRRFAFVDLEPAFGPSWRGWCAERGVGADLIATIEARVRALNATIAAAPSLGPQFRIGHSFLTPDEMVDDPVAWYRAMVETEIGPLLDEHWYDAPDTARAERGKLLFDVAE